MKVKQGWALREFVGSYGPKIKLGQFTNKISGEQYKALMIGKEGDWTQVSFSSNLGTLSATEIKSRASELRVVLLESDNYKLCTAGENAWEDIEL
jgi:hypothetical protein